MSSKTEDIKRKLNKRFKEASNQSFYAIVEEVDETMRTCKLKVGGISYEDVLLYSVVKDSLKGFVAIPAVGSKVLVGRIAGGDRLFVAMYSAIDRIKYTVGDVEVIGDVDGCRIIAKDSKVTVTAEKIEITATEIVMNGGDLGGLVKINELKTNLDNLKAYVEAIHSAIPGALSAIGAALASSGAAGSLSYTGSMAGKIITIEDMENKTITQG